MATRNCNTLTAKQKADLCFWLKELGPEDSRTFALLATVATEALGFAVTESNIQGWWGAVHGPRRTYPVRAKGFTEMLEDLDRRLTALERRVDALACEAVLA